MECREVRGLQDAYLDDELLVETNHEVLAHLEHCAGCRAELQARQKLRATLKNAFKSDERVAPTGEFTSSLKTHLQSTASTAGKSPWRARLPWLAAAAVVAAFAIQWSLDRSRSAQQLVDDPAMAQLIESAVGDHRDCALRHQPSEAPISLDQAASYDAALPGLDKAVRLSAATLPPPTETVGAHACIWRGRRFGHVVLSHKKSIVSVLVAGPEGSVGRYATAAPTVCSTTSEFAVACFAAPEHAVFVVADLPGNETLTLAEQLSPAVRGHLSRVLAALRY